MSEYSEVEKQLIAVLRTERAAVKMQAGEEQATADLDFLLAVDRFGEKGIEHAYAAPAICRKFVRKMAKHAAAVKAAGGDAAMLRREALKEIGEYIPDEVDEYLNGEKTPENTPSAPQKGIGEELAMNHAPQETEFEEDNDTDAPPLPTMPRNHEEIATILYRKFEEKDEHKNPKGLTYLKEKAIVRRLNEAFGVFGWQTEYIVIGSTVTCTISAQIGGVWLKRANGSGIQSKDEPQNVKQSMEDIVKTAYTDAFKRAARSWGIGWYLLG